MEQNSKNVILEKHSFYKSTQPIMLFERVMRNGQSEVMFNNQNGDKVTSVIKDKITVECLKNISFLVARDKANTNLPLIDAAKILHPMLLEKILYEYPFTYRLESLTIRSDPGSGNVFFIFLKALELFLF